MAKQEKQHSVRKNEPDGPENAEEELGQNQREVMQQVAELEHLLQNSPVGLAYFDTDLRYQRINKRMADMNGKPIEAHIRKTLDEARGALFFKN